MSLKDLSSRKAVLEAIEEYDRLGRKQFLAKYGFGEARDYLLAHDGKTYDSKAILGVAYGYQFPDEGPLSPSDFTGGLGSTVPKLKALGFEVQGTKSVSDDPWEEAVRLCRPLIEERTFLDSTETNFKLEISERVRAVLDAAREGEELEELLNKTFAPPNILVHYIGKSRFLKWAAANPDDARAALVAVQGDGPTAARVDGFLENIPKEVLGTPGERISFPAIFLMGDDPSEFPVYRAAAIRTVEKILGWPAVDEGASAGTEYEHHVAFVRAFLERLQNDGVEARDMLDAQSLLWILAKSDDLEYRKWRGDDGPEIVPNVNGGDGWEPDIAALSEQLYLDEHGWLEDAVDLLERKRQLIFYGPPGTGKTYIALRLMKHLAPAREQREVVQFHPSYSYEDFVRGYRPVDTASALSYEVINGPLVRLAKAARSSLSVGDSKPYILLIDEINRGNLPRILGELLFLLEYRSDEDGVQLLYGEEEEERFRLPENLWIIGTMNTADRSIGLIDAALRRRFHFKSLFPGEPPIAGTLRRWLHDNGSAEMADRAADLVDRLNDRLMEQQGAYGENLKVGHSYFMEEDLDFDLLHRIWMSDVLPYLEEQLFGREVDVKATFSLEALDSDKTDQPEAEGAGDFDAGPGTDGTGDEGLLDDAGNT